MGKEIFNILLEKLYIERLTACDYRIILCIARHTLGINKENVAISYGYISEETKTDERHVKKCMKALEEKGILYKAPGNIINLWGINQDYIYNFSQLSAYPGADASPGTAPMQSESKAKASKEKEHPGARILAAAVPGTKAEPMHPEKEPSSKASKRQQPIKRSCTSATVKKSTLAPGTKTKTKARAST